MIFHTAFQIHYDTQAISTEHDIILNLGFKYSVQVNVFKLLFHQLVFKCFLEGPRVCRVHRCRDHSYEHPDLRGREGRLVPDRQEEQDDGEGLPPHQGRVHLASECQFLNVGIKKTQIILFFLTMFLNSEI